MAEEPKPGSVDPVVTVAADLVDRGYHEAAIRHLEKAGVENGSALLVWGHALLQQGNSEQAWWKFEAATRAEPTLLEAYAGAGDALSAQTRYAEAETRYTAALEIDSSLPDLWTRRGLVRDELRRFDEAISDFTRAHEAAPYYVPAYIQRAEVLLKRERFEEALHAAQAGLRLIRQRPDARHWETQAQTKIAIAALYLRDFALAQGMFRHLIAAIPETDELNSYKANLLFLLGLAELSLHHHEAAQRSFLQARELDEGLVLPCLQGLAGVYAELGEYNKAWRAMEDIVITYRGRQGLEQASDPSDRQILAQALFFLGDFGLAEAEFEDIARGSPRDPAPWGMLTTVYQEHAEFLPEKAALLYAKAREAGFRAERLAEEGFSESRTVRRLLEAATLATILGQHEKARKYIDEVKGRDPSDPVAYFLAGLVSINENEPSAAASELLHACNLDPSNTEARTRLGAAYLQLGAADKAEEEFRSVLTTDRGNIEALIGLGETLTRIGETTDPSALDEAIETFTTVLALDETMALPPRERCASTRLAPPRRADVYYTRGYARVAAHERDRSTQFTLRRKRLIQAQADFSTCEEIEENHYRAKRALRKLEPLLPRTLNPSRLTELSQVIVAGLGVLVFVLVTTLFLVTNGLVGATAWLAGMFGSLVFVIAGLSLPDLLKLKVGGIELEKSVIEVSSATELQLTRGPLSLFGKVARLPQLDPALEEPARPQPAFASQDDARNLPRPHRRSETARESASLATDSTPASKRRSRTEQA